MRSIPIALCSGAAARPLLMLAVGVVAASAHARSDCFDDAGLYHGVNPEVLRAISYVETRDNPTLKSPNANGSVDYGLMQINSIHMRTLQGYRISAAMLMQPCVSVYVAAWHLKSKMLKYGNTWAAVGSYHSETPQFRDRYVALVINAIRHNRRRLPAGRNWQMQEEALEKDVSWTPSQQ